MMEWDREMVERNQEMVGRERRWWGGTGDGGGQPIPYLGNVLS